MGNTTSKLDAEAADRIRAAQARAAKLSRAEPAAVARFVAALEQRERAQSRRLQK